MKKLILASAFLAVLISVVFLFSNPMLFGEIDHEFSPGEVFEPAGDRYDFGIFALNTTNTSNFTVKIISSGWAQLIDGSGEYVINIVEYDKMLDLDRYFCAYCLDSERSRQSFEIEGVEVHVVDLGDTIRYASFVTQSD